MTLLTLLSSQGAPAPSNTFWIKISGTWKQATTWIKVSGVWKTATPNIKVSGVWE